MARPGREEVVRAVEANGVVAVVRLQDPDSLRAVVDALAEGGVRALEVTMTVPRSIEMIARLAPSLPDGFLLGAGTVLDPETARTAILAGAGFVAGPIFSPEVIAVCHRYDVAAVPGCFTPTEILAAWEAGADIVKVFPATSLGPRFLLGVRRSLPQVKLMPTGGVTADNAGEWLKAGAAAVGVGTALFDANAIEAGDYGTITANARRIVASVKAARPGPA